MGALAEAPGVMRKSTRIFVTQEDVAVLLGCGKSKAYDIVRDVNKRAEKKGNHPFPAGRANKYFFADAFGIPIEEVDKVINGEEVRDGIL